MTPHQKDALEDHAQHVLLPHQTAIEESQAGASCMRARANEVSTHPLSAASNSSGAAWTGATATRPPTVGPGRSRLPRLHAPLNKPGRPTRPPQRRPRRSLPCDMVPTFPHWSGLAASRKAEKQGSLRFPTPGTGTAAALADDLEHEPLLSGGSSASCNRCRPAAQGPGDKSNCRRSRPQKQRCFQAIIGLSLSTGRRMASTFRLAQEFFSHG